MILKISFSLFLILLLQFDSVGQWDLYHNEEAGFSVLAPGIFEEKVQQAITPMGRMDYHILYYHDEDTSAMNYVYMVSFCDYPSGSVHSDSLELVNEVFLHTREQAVKDLKGYLIYDKSIDLEGDPGWFWRIHYNNGKAVIKTKAFFHGNRYYAVQTVSSIDRSANRESERFLDSFRIIGD